MKKRYAIGEVAALKDITIKALRYYHQVGILVPSYIDETTGYRYYSIDQFITIDLIKACRALGTSIAELQEMFKSGDTETAMVFLAQKREEAKQQIKKMEEIIGHIDLLTQTVEKAKSILKEEEVKETLFEERPILTIPCEEIGDLKEVVYYSVLEKRMQEKGLLASVERGMIYEIDETGEMKAAYAFIGIKGGQVEEGDLAIKNLPRGTYLTLAYSKESEEKRIEKLLQYVHEKELTIKEIIEVELLADFFNVQGYSCQLQMFIG